MSLEISDVVLSLRGRDAGERFFVLSTDGQYAILCDGRVRRLEKPKRKKEKHLRKLSNGEGRIAEKLKAGEKVTNGEIRRALSGMEIAETSEGGMHIG